MAWSDFTYTPAIGIKDNITFPDSPGSSAAARLQIQTLLDQITTFFNTTAKAESAIGTYAADTGTANAYIVTLSPIPLAYFIGMPVKFKVSNANTGASTLNVNGLGAKAITKNGTNALVAGDISANQIVIVIYDGTQFQLVGIVPANVTVTANRLVVSNASGNMSASAVTDIEAGYISGTTSNIQTQITTHSTNVATSTNLGHVKGGSGTNISTDGTLTISIFQHLSYWF